MGEIMGTIWSVFRVFSARTNSCLVRASAFGLGLLIAAHATAQTPAEPMPVKDKTLTASPGHVQDKAWFGYTMAMGKLRGAIDTRDDIVACAVQEDDGAALDAGAAYVFEDNNLVPPADKPSRLLPRSPTDGLQMGLLDIEIDNIRGLTPSSAPYANLIIIGCKNRTARYPGCSGAVAMGGSVELFDFANPDFLTNQGISLIAPLNPGTCAVPVEVRGFGSGIAVGDVTRDGIRDLIVSASETDRVTPGDANGRVYVFAGRADFVPSSPLITPPYPPAAWQSWLGLDAPLDGFGTNFGYSVTATDFGGSGLSDIIVGRPDRLNKASLSNPQGGSTYVFRATWLHDLFHSSAMNTVVAPPLIGGAGWNFCEPQYQRLANPYGNLAGAVGDQLGWQVFAIGDVGSPPLTSAPNVSGPLDGIPDFAAHAEATNNIVSGIPVAPDIEGGLFVYLGAAPSGPCDYQQFVDPMPFLLQKPANVGPPEFGDRFGRACVGIDLYNPLTHAVERAILAGAPGLDDYHPGDRGNVYLFRLPLTRSAGGTPSTLNAWGTSPLIEPENPADDNLFGGWIVAGDYKSDPVQFPGQQFVVSARQAAVTDGSIVHPQAGKAYSFVPGGP